MMLRRRPLNSSRQTIQRRLANGRTIRWVVSWRQPPRLPISVPRSGVAISSPNGVTRFCRGNESGGRRAWTRQPGRGIIPALMTQPFAGITVLEFGHFIAVPWAGQALADGGAHVIKIEPQEGEPSRHIAPLG